MMRRPYTADEALLREYEALAAQRDSRGRISSLESLLDENALGTRVQTPSQTNNPSE